MYDYFFFANNLSFGGIHHIERKGWFVTVKEGVDEKTWYLI